MLHYICFNIQGGPTLSQLLRALLYWAVLGLSTQLAFAQESAYPEQQRPNFPQQQLPVIPAQQPPTFPEQQAPAYPAPQDRTAPYDLPQTQIQPPTEERPETVQDERTLLTRAHIALILPLQSTSYQRYADSIRLGVLSAASINQDPSLPVIVYATTDEPYRISEAYQRALSTGARAVIGPLTRTGVSALATSGHVEVPTLALNTPETDIRLPPNLYVFGLQIEAEARQAARMAFREGGRKALIVVGETPVGRRIAQAFKEEWAKLKADVADEIVYATDASRLGQLRELVKNTAADAIFLSLDAARARFIRPYLGTQLRIYTTSMVYTSNADKLELYDLDGVRFLDMPWLLQPDHPAVMTYLRPDVQTNSLDQERFYALGIDAYRIAIALLQGKPESIAIDGVTGAIKLSLNRHFTREPLPAYFGYGSAHILSTDNPR